MRVYLDACVLIYHIEGPESFSQAVSAALAAALRAECCITDLVRLECLVVPLRTGDTEAVTVYRERFAELTVLPMLPAVFDLAAALRAHHRLKTADALHAAAAIQHGCEEIWTADRRFAPIEGRIRVRVLGGGEP